MNCRTLAFCLAVTSLLLSAAPDTARADNWLEVIRATEKDALLLKTFVDTPLILLTTVSFLEDGRPLEYSMTAWLGDRIRFNFNINFSVSSPTSAIQMSLREAQL